MLSDFFFRARHFRTFNVHTTAAGHHRIPETWWFYRLVQYNSALILLFTYLDVHISMHTSTKCHIYLLWCLLRRRRRNIAIDINKILLSACGIVISEVGLDIFLAYVERMSHYGVNVVIFICLNLFSAANALCFNFSFFRS